MYNELANLCFNIKITFFLKNAVNKDVKQLVQNLNKLSVIEESGVTGNWKLLFIQ